MNFEEIWQRILKCEGEEFITVRNVKFKYVIKGESVVPEHTQYHLSKRDFEKAASIDNLQGPGQINKLVRGPSYVYAILTDPRIK